MSKNFAHILLTLLMVLALVALPLVVGCAEETPTEQEEEEEEEEKLPYKIGLPISLTGYMAAMGVPVKEGMVMVVDMLNEEGGIDGHPVELIIYDNESKEDKGVMVMNKLIEEDKVHVVCGTISTGITLASQPIAEEAKIPYMSNSASSLIAKPPAEWTFKPGTGEPPFFKNIFGQFKDVGVDRIAILNQGAAFGKSFANWFEDHAAEDGITVVIREEYDPAGVTAMAQLTAIKAADPEALWIWGVEAAGAIAVTQAVQMFDIPIFACSNLATGPLTKFRPDMEGVYMSNTYAIEMADKIPPDHFQFELIKDFRSDYIGCYGRDPSFFAGIGYDAITVVLEALKLAKPDPDPAELEEARKAIRDAFYELPPQLGIQHYAVYTPEEHRGYVWLNGDVSDDNVVAVTLSQIQDGDIKVIEW